MEPSSSSKNVSLEAQHMLETFWKRELLSVQNTTNNVFRNQELPLARIKKIMKLDEDVKMISGEAPILFAKAVEMFIAELSLRAWINTEENKRRTLQRNDIAMAITKYDQFDFLIDIVPREEAKPIKRHDSGSTAISNQDQYNYYVQIAQQQSLQTGTGQSLQIIQAPNQAQFSISPQIIQVPVPSSNQSHDNATIMSSPVVNLNQTSNSQVQQLPITLSSQQYQTLIQNQSSSHQNQQILLNQSLSVPTQYLTANTGQVVQTLISTSSSSNTTKVVSQQRNRQTES